MKTLKKYSANERPEISTASLPDIIFILLFFFMVVTVLRNSEDLLKIRLPSATELTKLKKQSLINHIYIGKPKDKRHGEVPKIQINDAFVAVEDIEEAILHCESTAPEHLKSKIINSLKVDEGAHMGIVTDVKLELRKANKLKVNYAAISRKGW